MVKLFAMEDDNKSSGNDLIIDKLLEKTKETKSPLSLTADLLKQRQEINKEVKDQLEEDDTDNEEDNSSNDDSEEENKESSEEESNDEDTEEEDSSDSEEEDNSESSEDDDKKKPEAEEEEDDSAAEDKDELNSLIGSGLGDKPETKKDKEETKPKEKEEVAEESLNRPASIRSIFKPLLEHNNKYRLSLENFNLEDKAVPVEKQPIVYVKEAILECISNLTKVSFSYIGNTNSFINTISESTLKLNERVTVFSGLVEAKKYHFTHKLVKDKGILENVSFKDHSDLRETSRALLKYVEQSNTAISLMVNNPFEEMKGAFTAKEFNEDGTDLVYAKSLPGFSIVKVALEPYSNYLKTKLENFQYFKLKAIKAEDLYSLSAISISEDKDLEYIVKTLNDLVAVTTVSIDTLKGVVQYFTTFTDELKVLSFDIQNDQYTNLVDLGIDEKIKSFIKFKLAMEANFININMIIDYVTSVSSVLDICLELSE